MNKLEPIIASRLGTLFQQVVLGATRAEKDDMMITVSSELIPWLCDVCPHHFIDGNCVYCGAGDTP